MNTQQLTNKDQYRAAYLAGHCPDPDISSDYDKGVIFAAIEKGEGATE